jgi:hypothetical protein
MPADGQVSSRRKPAVTAIRAHPAAPDGGPARTPAADGTPAGTPAADGTPARTPAVDEGATRKPAAGGAPPRTPAKPTLERLQVDLAALDWQRSGAGAGSLEVAFVSGTEPGRADWVLLRVAGDPEGRVLVYDRTEWLCFIDGAGRGEFDSPPDPTSLPT